MPDHIFEVELPTGEIIEVEAPADTPPDAIRQRVQAYRMERAGISRDDPTSGMSTAQLASSGVGHSLFETARGVKQALGDAFNSGTDLLGRMAGQDRSAQRRAKVDEQRKLDAPLLATRPGFWGDVVGTVGQVVAPGGAAKLGMMVPEVARMPRAMAALDAVKSASLPSTVKGAAAQGGLLGYVQPVGTDESRATNTGLGFSGGLLGAFAPRAAGSLARWAKGEFVPSGAQEKAARIIMAEAERPSALMTPTPSQIPGVQRTLAQETLDPGIARLERNARSGVGGFDSLDRTNNAAHIAAIRQFAGDDAAMAAAKEARDRVALPALSRAKQVSSVDTAPLLQQVDALIEQYTGNPAVQDGLREARKAIAASGGNLAHLENARQYIGRLISGTANNNGAKLHELMDVKDSLVGTLGSASPDFDAYLQAYAAGSRPLNRMQIGQSLLNSRSGSAILDPVTGEQVLTPAAFSRRARDLDRVAQEATQFKRAKAADYLEPADFATIRNVQDDLERKAFAATAGSGGNSQTFERLKLQEKMAGGMAARLPFIGKAADYLGQIGEVRLQARLAEMLANPAQARLVFNQLSTRDKRVVEQAIRRSGGTVGALVFPALKQDAP